MQLMAKEPDGRPGPLTDSAVSSQLERLPASELFRRLELILVENFR